MLALAGYVVVHWLWLIAGWGGTGLKDAIGDLFVLPVGFRVAVMAWRAAAHPPWIRGFVAPGESSPSLTLSSGSAMGFGSTTR
ncbi:MAG: hypothetical protein U0531_21935 [Dehalococcoidia bacterium]